MSHTILKATVGDEYKPCRHKDCRFRTNFRDFHRCNYMALTGRSRIAQHSPDEQSPDKCRLYEKGPNKNLKNKGVAPYGR